MPDLVEIRVNPPDLFKRMAKYPKELDRAMEEASNKSLLHLWAKVPEYPQQRPGSTYRRTFTLGRSLGSSMGGSFYMGGRADIHEVKRLGQGKYEARFGTRVHYAPHVIGSDTQWPLFQRLGWWTMRDVKERAEQGIIKIFNDMAAKLVDFLGG